MKSLLLAVLFAMSGALVAGCDEQGNLLTDDVAAEGIADEDPGIFENGPPPPMLHMGPPPEAFEACADLSRGDTCAVAFGEKEIEGRCRRGPDGEGELACVPERPPRRHGPPPMMHRHGPPPEAFEACESLSVDNACEVEIHGRTVAGKCRRGPSGEAPLSCAPDEMPPPPPVRASDETSR